MASVMLIPTICSAAFYSFLNFIVYFFFFIFFLYGHRDPKVNRKCREKTSLFRIVVFCGSFSSRFTVEVILVQLSFTIASDSAYLNHTNQGVNYALVSYEAVTVIL